MNLREPQVTENLRLVRAVIDDWKCRAFVVPTPSKEQAAGQADLWFAVHREIIRLYHEVVARQYLPA